MKAIAVGTVLGALLACTAWIPTAPNAAQAADGAGLYAQCAGCHGADGGKAALGAARPLKGQTADALYGKLKGYADGSYGGSKKAVMAGIAKKLSDEDMRALAAHMASF
ncbi:c-type cytochrome [Nitratidesulfovibrio liaohensis]|uniref:C-type cytochrome n=1 Tax=Nitratidesulfovibrio liaohensis TaxID=2604158 RepID=A0ABY9R2X9_9BACT|nr:c-type cytochrome [Nitratidesulfovibrio liaohensis]WMW66111.1 c-type cytochrome [Nitratidesulfovibrio liaohensis]